MLQLDYGTVLRLEYPNVRFTGSGNDYSKYKAKAGSTLPSLLEVETKAVGTAKAMLAKRRKRDSDRASIKSRKVGVAVQLGSKLVVVPSTTENRLALSIALQGVPKSAILRLATGLSRFEPSEVTTISLAVNGFENKLEVI